MESAIRLTESQAKTYVKEYLETGDPSLAWRAAYPGSRKISADKRGPLALELPVVQNALLHPRSQAAESVTDESVLAQCRGLLTDPSLTPRERLAAMTTYNKLRQGIGADSAKADTGEWAAELRAFLRDQGVEVG